MKILNSFTRIYVNDIDSAISFYESIFLDKVRMRFSHAEVKLKLAIVGSILILAGNAKDLEPFIKTKATFVVDSVKEVKDFILNNGGAVIRDINSVPTGYNLTMKNKDGNIFEYVQFT